MELSDEELTLFEIAYHLRIPVYKLVEEMPYEEFLGWCSYFERRPVGWRDDYRAYTIISSNGVKVKPEKVFTSLESINNHRRKVTDVASSIKGSYLQTLIQTSVGGDKIDFN